MSSIQKLAGVSSIACAMIYIFAFIMFATVINFPLSTDAKEVMTYLAANRLLISLIYFLIYVVFGVLLAFVVVGIKDKMNSLNAPLLQIANLFGAIWVGLVIAGGMIFTLGVANAVERIDSGYDQAFQLWVVISVITESIGGGNELVGGLWVLLVSVVGLKHQVFSKGLNVLGIVVGIAGVATVYPAELFTEIFGISQIGWFIWLGISLLVKPSLSTQVKQQAGNA